MRWVINISRENGKIKIILEEIDCKLTAKHVEKGLFQTCALVSPQSRNLRVSSASSSEDATNHPSQRHIEGQPSNFKQGVEVREF
jgi:hypothetical protein